MVISSSSPPVAPPPPSLLLAPPRRAQPSPPVFLVGGLAGCPDSLPPCPCSSAQAFIFPLDHGALAIGVEENPLVVEIVPVDLFVDDYVSFFSIPFLDSRYYHGALTLTSMYLVF